MHHKPPSIYFLFTILLVTRIISLSRTRATKIPLLHGRCIGGLYPLSFHDLKQAPVALLMTCSTPELWHQRLGHLGTFALKHVLHNNNLLVSSLNNNTNVCNACRMAKRCQLPFLDSYNKTSSPLELVHTHVGSPAIYSSSGCRYYISFINVTFCLNA
jgi:hypothetical protein